MRRWLAVLAVLLAWAGIGHARSKPAQLGFTPGEVLVKFAVRPADAQAQAASLLTGAQVKVTQARPLLRGLVGVESPELARIYNVSFAGEADAPEVAARLAGSPEIVWAEPNRRLDWDAYIPNDPQFIHQHSLLNRYPGTERLDIHAPEAWTIHRGDPRVVVAVVDSGADLGHEDLRDRLWRNTDEVPNNGFDDDMNGFVDDYHGWDFSAERSSVFDSFGHGTHVAGIVGAMPDNGVGIAGVDHFCTIMPVKIGGISGLLNEDAVRGVLYAVTNGADLVNASWGSPTFAEVFVDMAAYARSRGVLIIASAGNNNTEIPHYPGALPDVLGVGAVDAADIRSFWETGKGSNYGPWVDIMAPGTKILSLWPGSGYQSANGTSMAAPLVTGVASLVKANFPGICCEEIKGRLMASAEPIDERNPAFRRNLGTGRVNAHKALSIAPRSHFSLRHVSLREAVGNGDSHFQSGEVFDLQLVVENSWRQAYDVNMALSFDLPGLSGDRSWQLREAPGHGSRQYLQVSLAAGEVADQQSVQGRLRIVSPLEGRAQEEGFTFAINPQTPNLSGWPLTFDAEIGNEATLANLDGLPGDELIVILGERALAVSDREGTVLPGWPVDLPASTISTPAVGDIDGDGLLEIAIGDTVGNVSVFNRDGGLLPGWPQTSGGHGFPSSLTLADLTGDGLLEIIDPTWSGNVSVWRHDGTLLPEWPIDVGAVGTSTSAAVASLLGGPEQQVIFGDKGSLMHVYAADGTPVAGWPQRADATLLSAPVVMDLDNDGDPEILCVSTAGSVWVWHHHGAVANGWPQSLGEYTDSTPAVHDFDGDGKPEIVLLTGEGTISVLRGDGSAAPGFPIAIGRQTSGSPAIGDVDGDGEAEILFSVAESLVALDHEANVKTGWPVFCFQELAGSPNLGDVDGDGDVEALVNTTRLQTFAIDTPGDAQSLPWPTYQGDLERKGSRLFGNAKIMLAGWLPQTSANDRPAKALFAQVSGEVNEPLIASADGWELLLNDEGRNGDLVAGDGIWMAFAPEDWNERSAPLVILHGDGKPLWPMLAVGEPPIQLRGPVPAIFHASSCGQVIGWGYGQSRLVAGSSGELELLALIAHGPGEAGQSVEVQVSGQPTGLHLHAVGGTETLTLLQARVPLGQDGLLDGLYRLEPMLVCDEASGEGVAE